jgi:hypothetical protein
MKLRIACLTVGFCSLVLAINAQDSGSTKPTSPLPPSSMIVETASQSFPLKLSTTILSFGQVVIDTTSTPQVVTLTNVGTTALKIILAFAGSDPHEFAQTNTCGSPLPAASSCSVSVTFTPKATGDRTAALSIYYNGHGSPQTVSLGGDGITGKCIRYGGECRPGINHCCAGTECHSCGDRDCCQ